MSKHKDITRAAAQFAAYTFLALAPVLGIHALAYALVPVPPVQGGLTFPACATEDSTGCYWDASEQGNGLGEDLWN